MIRELPQIARAINESDDTSTTVSPSGKGSRPPRHPQPRKTYLVAAAAMIARASVSLRGRASLSPCSGDLFYKYDILYCGAR